ncbi:MAG: protein nirF [Deltaproteobacteria bacterium]|nr:protein nirF [Deltaproteobacteria bacterium]
MKPSAALALCLAAALSGCAARQGSVGSRVFVVERNDETLAVYDLTSRAVVGRIGKLGNLQHATMTFSPDLRYGYVASRSGKLSQIDLAKMERAGEVFTSKSSIDIAVSQDGRYIATAEYVPGGLTILDAQTLAVVKRIPAPIEVDGQQRESRVTGVVDAPGNRFVCVLMEGHEVWVVDASRPDFPIERRVPVIADEPYDAMITPDGRHYVVGHLNTPQVSVIDLAHAEPAPRLVSLQDPAQAYQRGRVVKLPHLASWAVARGYVFVPLVGEKRLALLDRNSWEFKRSIAVRGHPVYAVRAPGEREVWVSFSGEDDDAYVQVIDTETLAVTHTIRIGGRVYHMDFTPRGSHLLASANRDNKLVLVNTTSYSVESEVALRSPSGIFGVWRAFISGL